MRRLFLLSLACVCLALPFRASAADAVEPSSATYDCLACHDSIHPGITENWRSGRHARITPGRALKTEGLSSRMSAQSIPDDLKDVSVGCAECHMLRPEKHPDSFDHNGYTIHTVVTPDDCATCHPDEAEQFTHNIMSQAHDNLARNDLFGQLVTSINGTPQMQNGALVVAPPNRLTNEESCYSCHGTALNLKGFETRETMLGPMDFPVLEGWPNGGVGRKNLDGSQGSCSSCHLRHAFSIETARKPYTCKECHVGPDVPVYKVYATSKHGKLFESSYGKWDFDAVPWTIGKDFDAPTCAACHVSLTVNTEGSVVAERTHRMNDRLPWRLFGLVYAHAHPKKPATWKIRNADGLPLPVTLKGEPAESFLIGPEEREKRRKTMQTICLNCHDASWVDGHWQRFENTLDATNAVTRSATDIMLEIWDTGLAAGPGKGNPFDEYPERIWSDTWLFYANSVRFTSAMAGGGDLGVFERGRYQLTSSVAELHDWLQRARRMR